MKIIFDYNRTLFNPDTDTLHPGVLELLKKLFLKHDLFLISRNEPLRKKRLEELNIQEYFQKMIFVDKKTRETFGSIIGDSKNILVVGDRISEEIQIGNQLGTATVRMKKGMFALEIPKNESEVADFEITDIRELENIITQYENTN